EIREKNYTTLEEVLRHVPGVDIQRSGGLGKTSAIRIRGAGPQQVQVLVDGMRVKSPTLGVTELSDLSIDAIERIEVVRATQSTLSGRLDYDFPWAGSLTFTGRYSKTWTDLPIFSTNPTVFDPNAQQQSETYLYTLSYAQKVVDAWDTRFRYGQWWNNAGF